MKYIQTTTTLAPHAEPEVTTQLLTYFLGEIGYESFITEGSELLAYLPLSEYSEEKLKEVLSHELLSSKVQSYTSEEQPDINWNEEWEKHYYQPVVVREKELAVRASFHKPLPEVPLQLIIDPKMAFGTGNHATTLGMLQLLLDEPLRDKTIIDMGCGSGILGILAMRRGAKSCTSIDIDEWSVQNAIENATVNAVHLNVLQGDATLLPKHEKADLLLANINRNIILQDLPHYTTALLPTGKLLLSGFLKQDLPIIQEALSLHGYHISRTLNPSGDWIALRAEMP